MKNYELTYLITPEIAEEQARELQNRIISLIQTEGGILLEEKAILKRRLAYTLKHQGQAYLSTLIFQSAPEKLVNIEKTLKSESQILRYLILAVTAKKEVLTRRRMRPEVAFPGKAPVRKPEKKVELEEIEKKLEEILKE